MLSTRAYQVAGYARGLNIGVLGGRFCAVGSARSVLRGWFCAVGSARRARLSSRWIRRCRSCPSAPA